ncbi:MAG TPA: biopolymer transporter ExbD [Acidobacteriaceae bacterium]|jgi:biopolymer transport protein ExbD/biopolymer transport protein TolR|nr:biopolymer transporter ExbD [Acidobacteriaceae bacterium]
MAIVVRNEGKKVTSDINVTPMVDVMLVLLIIFMVITPMLDQKVNVTLAQTDSAVAMQDASKQDAVTVAVTRDNKVYLGQDQTTLANLGTAVATKIQNKTDKTVYFRADARSHYGTVEDAIDAVRTAGVEQIAFLTDNRESNQPPSGVAGNQ